MTHTLHRSGTPDSLRDDFPWLMYWSRGINDIEVRRKCLEIVAAAEQAGCENWGDTKAGSVLVRSPEEVKRDLTEKSRVRGVFTSKGQVVEFLRTLKEEDLGMSVIISGLLEEVLDACHQAGVTPHTINFSLGVWGKKALLPSEDVLEITTMCGHHMIASTLVEKLVEDIRRNKTTPRRAALRCARLCPCGVFNHVRAERLFAQMAGK